MALQLLQAGPRYWDSNTEIDIAALDPEGNNLILGECKYWQEPAGVSVLRDVKEKAKTVSWKRETRKTCFVLFGCNGFTEELREIAAGIRGRILDEEPFFHIIYTRHIKVSEQEPLEVIHFD